jgi:uncharacterized membrane protein
MNEPVDQRGLSTAEYAVGTLAVVTGVGALVAVWIDPLMPIKVLWPIMNALFGFILRTFGIAGG